MALPSSGALSLSMVNTELNKSAFATISMNDAAVRALGGVASGAISLSNFYGKSGLTLINTFSVSLARGPDSDPASGYNIYTAAPDRYYEMVDTTLGTMLGYSTWQLSNIIYEPASASPNSFVVSLPARTQQYTGLTSSSIKAIEVDGVLYDSVGAVYVNIEIYGYYICTWSFLCGEVVLAPGAHTVKVYR